LTVLTKDSPESQEEVTLAQALKGRVGQWSSSPGIYQPAPPKLLASNSHIKIDPPYGGQQKGQKNKAQSSHART
ncbi:hypothetical protein, partial [Synechocystis salina]|uniref:hypothetical protein n=1 Tax=Synechocystis salina TaxID=945780 RepID=UPI001D15D10D